MEAGTEVRVTSGMWAGREGTVLESTGLAERGGQPLLRVRLDEEGSPIVTIREHNLEEVPF